MAGALTAMTLPGSAAFLYVPPDVPALETTKAAGSDIGSTAAVEATDRAAGGPSAGRTVEQGAGDGGQFTPPLQITVTTADPEPGGPAGSGAEPAASGTTLWHVRVDETLRGVMDRWAAREGIDVLFLTDRRYRLHEARAFEGSFEEAATALFDALSHLPHAPVGVPKPDGRTLAVLHRVRPAGGGR